MTSGFAPAWRRRVAALLVFACAGCATVPPGTPRAQQIDPFEGWNRQVFAFNEALDDAILQPVATVYAEVVPQVVRRGIGNFYANIADAWSAVNNLLQGKPCIAGEVAFSFAVNSSFGLAGVFDLASEMGIERHYEDFGQTLGVWGAAPGAFLVWPLIGPSTVRDSIALPLNYAASPMDLFNVDLRGSSGSGRCNSSTLRAGLLGAGACSTTSRSTSTPSSATPTCSGDAAWFSTATSHRPPTPRRTSTTTR